jgi:hypothetical protein
MSYSLTLTDFVDFTSTYKGLIEPLKQLTLRVVFKFTINSHIWPPPVARWPFFSPFGYGKLMDLVSICNSLSNSEGMTIFGSNDNNPEGITIIRKE